PVANKVVSPEQPVPMCAKTSVSQKYTRPYSITCSLSTNRSHPTYSLFLFSVLPVTHVLDNMRLPVRPQFCETMQSLHAGNPMSEQVSTMDVFFLNSSKVAVVPDFFSFPFSVFFPLCPRSTAPHLRCPLGTHDTDSTIANLAQTYHKMHG